MVNYKEKTDEEIEELFNSFNSKEKRDAVKQSVLENIDSNFDEIEREYKLRNEKKNDEKDVDMKEGDFFIYVKSSNEGDSIVFFEVVKPLDDGDVYVNKYSFFFNETCQRTKRVINTMLPLDKLKNMHICTKAFYVMVRDAFLDSDMDKVSELLNDFFAHKNNNEEISIDKMVDNGISAVGQIYKTSKYDGRTLKMRFERLNGYNEETKKYTYTSWDFTLSPNEKSTSSKSGYSKSFDDFKGELCDDDYILSIKKLFDNSDVSEILKMEGYEYDGMNKKYKSGDKGYVENTVGLLKQNLNKRYNDPWLFILDNVFDKCCSHWRI